MPVAFDASVARGPYPCLAGRLRHRLAAILIAGLIGCGSGADKLPLAGSVTFDGEPVAQGSIEFSSASGPGVSATITDGRFSLPAEQGVPAGSYKVRIYGYAPTGREIADSDLPGQTVPEMKSIVPASYNENSTLSADVTADNSTSLSYALETPAS